jgi:FtsH-binding integral membrane protein
MTELTHSIPRDKALSIFSKVMGLVAITCLFAAGGAYVGRNLSGLSFLIPFIAAFACLFALNAANRKGAHQIALTFLFAFGLLLGIAVGQTISYYASTDQNALYQAAAATGLFVGALGAGGYAIRRDLSYLYRIAFFMLVALIAVGIISIFVAMPGGYLVYSIFGLIVFGLYTVLDFNRLKRAGESEVIPLAAGIFLNVFNIFLFMLRIFGGR